MGPLTDTMKAVMKNGQGDLKFDIEWTTLGEYLEFLETRGVATNVASFLGAATTRIHELGYDDVDPTPEQLHRMRGLVAQAMEEGALGIGSSLIYAPGAYAETDELSRSRRKPVDTVACTSRTCAAKGTGCSLRSMS